jgi:protein-disulfide isomerase
MKKIITITIIVLAVLGVGWYLFKISPQDNNPVPQIDQLDTSGVVSLTEPLPIQPDDFILGNKDAKNTFVAYEDFQCPACASFETVLQQIPSELQDTKVVFRAFPLVNNHQNALVSAYAAFAAGAQGKFWEYTKILFTKQSEWEFLPDPSQNFIAFAQEAGIPNLDQFKNDFSSKKYKPEIEKDNKEALGLKLVGTPSLFFNGKPLELGNIDSIKTQVKDLYNK